MELKQKCKCCNGTGEIKREIKAGDIVRPYDGSGLPNGLHSILRNGLSSEPAFKPVRVLAVEGKMLGIVPVHWDNPGIRHKELWPTDKENYCYYASTWIWEGTWKYHKVLTEYGFWIDGEICHVRLA